MFINDLPWIMIKCLLITIIIETIIAILIGFRNKDMINVILVNMMTNPLAVSISTYVGYRYGPTMRGIAIAILEILIVGLEGALYCRFAKYKKINGFVISIILNGSSFFIGKMIANS